MKRKLKSLLFIIISASLLVACSGQIAAPPSANGQPVEPTGPQGETEYPALSQPSQEELAYPMPQQQEVDEGYPVEGFPSVDANSLRPGDAPEPQPGHASISGILYSTSLERTIPGTMFYLTEGLGEDKTEMPPAFVGPIEGSRDFVAYTDSGGQFSIDNIPPGNYFLVVQAPMNWAVAQISRAEFKPLLLELEAGEKLSLGVVYVSWP